MADRFWPARPRRRWKRGDARAQVCRRNRLYQQIPDPKPQRPHRCCRRRAAPNHENGQAGVLVTDARQGINALCVRLVKLEAQELRRVSFDGVADMHWLADSMYVESAVERIRQ